MTGGAWRVVFYDADAGQKTSIYDPDIQSILVRRTDIKSQELTTRIRNDTGRWNVVQEGYQIAIFQSAMGYSEKLIFHGQIYSKGHDEATLALKAWDWSHMTVGPKVFATYKNKKAYEVVKDIIANYVNRIIVPTQYGGTEEVQVDHPIDTTQLDTGGGAATVFPNISFSDEDANTAINRIADQIGYRWYMDFSVQNQGTPSETFTTRKMRWEPKATSGTTYNLTKADLQDWNLRKDIVDTVNVVEVYSDKFVFSDSFDEESGNWSLQDEFIWESTYNLKWEGKGITWGNVGAVAQFAKPGCEPEDTEMIALIDQTLASQDACIGGFFAGYKDSNNYWAFILYFEDGGTTCAEVHQIKNGVGTLKSRTYPPIAPGYNKIRLVVSNNIVLVGGEEHVRPTYEFYVGNEFTAGGSGDFDSKLSGGAGIVCGGRGIIRFDDFMCVGMKNRAVAIDKDLVKKDGVKKLPYLDSNIKNKIEALQKAQLILDSGKKIVIKGYIIVRPTTVYKPGDKINLTMDELGASPVTLKVVGLTPSPDGIELILESQTLELEKQFKSMREQQVRLFTRNLNVARQVTPGVVEGGQASWKYFRKDISDVQAPLSGSFTVDDSAPDMYGIYVLAQWPLGKINQVRMGQLLFSHYWAWDSSDCYPELGIESQKRIPGEMYIHHGYHVSGLDWNTFPDFGYGFLSNYAWWSQWPLWCSESFAAISGEGNSENEAIEMEEKLLESGQIYLTLFISIVEAGSYSYNLKDFFVTLAFTSMLESLAENDRRRPVFRMVHPGVDGYYRSNCSNNYYFDGTASWVNTVPFRFTAFNCEPGKTVEFQSKYVCNGEEWVVEASAVADAEGTADTNQEVAFQEFTTYGFPVVKYFRAVAKETLGDNPSEWIPFTCDVGGGTLPPGNQCPPGYHWDGTQCVPDQPPISGTIKVYVFNGITQQPIQGALVNLWGESSGWNYGSKYTDYSGWCEWNNVAVNEYYLVWASANGYFNSSDYVFFLSGYTEVRIAMNPIGANVTVTVHVHDEHLNPVWGAATNFVDPGYQNHMMNTDHSGNAVQTLPAGPYTLYVHKTGYYPDIWEEYVTVSASNCYFEIDLSHHPI